jgi:WD40 repeat protein
MNTTKAKIFNPFPGLRPFTIEESHLFFGREGQSDEVLNLLTNNRFAAVIGTSGSGKSSLMYCGVVPTLHGGFVTGAGSDWKIMATRPGQSPINNLASTLTDHQFDNLSEEDQIIKKSQLAAILSSSSKGLVEAIQNTQTNKKENILLLVDQFEELFRFKKSTKDSSAYNESLAYVKLLLEAVKQSEVPIYMVLTMRSDFIGECAQFPNLTSMINESHYLIPQMTREDFRECIVGPVAVGGGTISSHLVQELLNDTGDNPDQLPILQHALMRTWNYWENNTSTKEPITIEHYEAIGKMEKALSEHANEAYDELNEREKIVCESIFKTITEKGADNRGIRHPTKISDIAQIAKSDLNEISTILNKFRSGNRSFLTPSLSAISIVHEDTYLDISHESLMRIWNKLIAWVDEEANAVNMYIRLCDASALFQQGKTGLWRPPDLQLALNWKDKKQPTLKWAQRFNPAFEPAMVYLNTSEQTFIQEEENKLMLQKRALRRSRIFAIVLGSASVISLLFLINSIIQQQEAVKQTLIAEENSVKAQEQTILAQQSTDEAKKQQEIAHEKSIEAEQSAIEAQKQAEIAQEQSAIAQEQQARALASAKEARKQQKLADQKSIEAELSADEAKAQQAIAEQASTAAYKLRLLSIAQSMAVKSVKLHKDTNQQALVAYQAFKFNSKNDGEHHNPDIYDGLYYSLKTLNDPNFNNLVGHTDGIRSIKCSQTSNRLYTTGSDGLIYKWDLDKANDQGQVFAKSENVNRSMSISKDSKWLAVGTNMATIELFDVDSTGKVPLVLDGHEGDVWDLQFRPNKNELISCASDGTIFLWDLTTKQYTVIAKSEVEIKSIAVSPDGNLIIGGLDNGKIIAWDLANENTSRILIEEKKNKILKIEFNNEGTIIAYGDKSGNVKLLNVNTQEIVQELDGHSARINDIKFSPDGSQLATASSDGSVQLWSTANFNLQPIVLNDHDSWVLSIAFSTDGLKLIAGCRDNLVRIWPTKTELMAEQICPKLYRNLDQEEWNRFVAEDIKYEFTCEDLEKSESK